MTRKRASSVKRPALPAETRPAEATTVAWMLVTLTTLLCELGVVLARAVLYFQPAEELMLVLANLLLFAAVVLGIGGLLLSAAVLKVRQITPPRPVTIFATVICAAPIVFVLLRMIFA